MTIKYTALALFTLFSSSAMAHNIPEKGQWEWEGKYISGAEMKKGGYNEYGTKYPVNGFRDGLQWHINAYDDLPQMKTARFKAYKQWADDHGVDSSKIEANPNYTYTYPLGPGAPLDVKNIMAGTFTFEPGAVYAVGQHPSWETYVVVSGEGEFYNYDQVVTATPGTFVLTRPFDVHAIKNTGDVPMEVVWFWWKEDDASLDSIHVGGLPFMPEECWTDEDPQKHCLTPPQKIPAAKGEDAANWLYEDK
ncbi:MULTISPECIES: cupin domain-containing protein [unclassified Shewanella]|uniref:cupin domain-containing protein n=1 Tax=unclassified Shewanella TaxID=196818 RepID=UPI000C865603|nr:MULTISPECIES: cupin domain-containing protein [unclassified Shewanella]MDO6775136.1 cupin domain-containing protein [Shewanella sp. 3_MG-2023]PMG49552.1 hypothetical protein BCU91_02430 [Shewanella sp. 10N.286.52.B9]